MKTLEKIAVLIILLLGTLPAYPQYTFEKVFDNIEQAEISAAIETPDNDFLFAVSHAGTSVTDDYVMKISSQGDEIGTFNHEATGGYLKFLGLFEHPNYNGVYIIPALVHDGQVSTEIAIISFDKDLNLLDEKRSAFSDMVQNLSPMVIPSVIIYDNEIAVTAHVMLKTGGYGHLYARLDLDGGRLAAQTDDSYNTITAFTSSIALINKSKKDFAVLNRKVDSSGSISLFIDTMDSTMTVRKSGKIEYDNSGSSVHISFRPFDTPVLKQLEDSIIMMNVMSQKYIGASPSHYGNCLVETNNDLEITNTTFYFHDQSNISVRLPLRNSFEIRDDYIISCAIINLHSYHPYYKTQCLVTKYDRDMNIIWERFVNQEEGYYYPHYILATEDGGCLLAGYSCDEDYQNKLAYVLKTDADGYLATDELYDVEVKPYYFYPNPSTDRIYIEFSPDVTCRNVEIYSLDGRLVKTQNFNLGAVDVSSLTSGVYLMKAKMADGKEFSERIVKE